MGRAFNSEAIFFGQQKYRNTRGSEINLYSIDILPVVIRSQNVGIVLGGLSLYGGPPQYHIQKE